MARHLYLIQSYCATVVIILTSLSSYTQSKRLFVDLPKNIEVSLAPSFLGKRFDGIGGVSGGGGGTRLLLDYPPTQRSQILDFLFRPKFGAALHILKVEIGCDGDTTQGSEQSHMRSENDFSSTAFQRGYENWLMVEAKKRNPNILLSGLEWGVPGWVATSGSIFTDKNQDYLIKWIVGLRDKLNLTIDSLGVGFNERGYNTTFIKEMRKVLNSHGLSHIKTIASDQCCGSQWNIAKEMLSDSELRDAIDVIGTHCPGPLNGQSAPPPNVVAMQKQLWNTEQHFGLPDPSSAKCWEWRAAKSLAQTLNQNYINANQTSVQMWTPIYSWYQWIFLQGKGFMQANTPWSGYFNVTTPIWITAHTTQFTEPGWTYLGGSACRLLPHKGSIVSYLAPNGKDFSIVIETMDAHAPQNIVIQLKEELAHVKSVHAWMTSQSMSFHYNGTISVSSTGEINISLPPEEVWTLSTTTDQQKGSVSIPEEKPFSKFLPYSDDFENGANDGLPRFFSDMHGAFSIYTESTNLGESANKVFRQNIDKQPVCTHCAGYDNFFVSAIGDTSWQNYTITVKAMVESSSKLPLPAEQIIVIGSHIGKGPYNPSALFISKPPGFVLLLKMDSTWSLLLNGNKLTSGKAPSNWTAGTWLDVSFAVKLPAFVSFDSDPSGKITVSAIVNSKNLFETQTSISSALGASFLGTGMHQGRFDDFSVKIN